MPSVRVCTPPRPAKAIRGRADREALGRAIPRRLESFYVKAEQKLEYLFVRNTEGPSIGREDRIIDDRYYHDIDELMAEHH